MIDVKSFTYEQYYNDDLEDHKSIYVENIKKDISVVLEKHFTNSDAEMIDFLQEIHELNLDKVEVLQIKTLEKNAFLIKKQNQALHQQ